MEGGVSHFYGLDWAASVAQLVSMEMLARKRRSGWVWKIIATLLWLGFNLVVGSFPAAAMSAVYIAMNVRGYLKWSN